MNDATLGTASRGKARPDSSAGRGELPLNDLAQASDAVSAIGTPSVQFACFRLAVELLRNARGHRSLSEVTNAATRFHAFVVHGGGTDPSDRLEALRTGVHFSSAALMTVGEAIAVAEASLAFGLDRLAEGL